MGYGSGCEEVSTQASFLHSMADIGVGRADRTTSGHQDVMGVLEDVCEESLQATNFFHGGPARNDPK